VKLMVDHGANVNAATNRTDFVGEGDTARPLAAERGDTEVPQVGSLAEPVGMSESP
jgi:hypothetical protein